MAPKLKPRGNPTNQLFAHWIFLGTPCRPKGPHSAQGEALGGQMEARELQNGAKMDSKLSPKGATWRENEALSEPKLIKQSMKNKAVECYSLHALMRTLWRK